MTFKMRLVLLGICSVFACKANDTAETAIWRQSYMFQYAREHFPVGMDANLWYDFEALFFDLDGNGVDESLIACKVNRDNSGNGWNTTRRNVVTGRIESHPILNESGFSIYSHSWALYVVSFNGVRGSLYGNDVIVHDIRNFGTRDHGQKIYRDDVLLKMDANGLLCATSVKNGFFDLVANPGFKRLDRAQTEFYRGAEMQLVKRTETATDISLIRPQGFIEFIRKYREEIKRRSDIKRKMAIFAVFIDADNDGDADFYVSSDNECRQNGQNEWHLYLNDGGKIARAENVIWFNAGKRRNREAINPDEVAGKDSFYRIQRKDGFVPSIVILDREGNTFHSRASLRQRLSPPPVRQAKHLSYDKAKEFYHALEEWQWNQRAKLGFIPADDFEELIIRHDFLRLERLECETFPEE